MLNIHQMKTKEIVLERTYFMNSVNGSLSVDNEYICKTIELPWKRNELRVSCIPEGRYRVIDRFSPKFGRHWHIVDVPNRSFILIHPANNALKELAGCIAPVSVLTGEGLGGSSVKAMQRLFNTLTAPHGSNVVIWLTIKNKDGLPPYTF